MMVQLLKLYILLFVEDHDGSASNQKLFHIFCQNVPSSTIRKCILYMVYCIPYIGNTVDFLPYMVDTVGEKKTAKHGEMRWTPKQ